MIQSKEIKLQTRLFSCKIDESNRFSDLCTIITHPHPLYGGNYFNNVVVGVSNELAKKGISCATFNFRGVESSTGEFDNGVGEQEDLILVSNFLLDDYENNKFKKIFICGYSFGAIVALAAIDRIKNKIGACYISYPFGNKKINYNLNIPTFFINGNKDSIAHHSSLLKEIKTFTGNKIYHIIENADHFYRGFEELLGQKIFTFINDNF